MTRLYCLTSGIALLLLGLLAQSLTALHAAPGARLAHLASGAVLVCLGAAGWGARFGAQASGLAYTLAALLGILSVLLSGGWIPVLGIQARDLYIFAHLVIGWTGLWIGFRAPGSQASSRAAGRHAGPKDTGAAGGRQGRPGAAPDTPPAPGR